MSWKSIIRKLAPTIATGLGGPMAGTTVKFLADKFLGDPDASEKDVKAAIENATTDQLIALKKLDNDFVVQLKELDIDLAELEVEEKKIEAEDRGGAREMGIKTSLLPQIVLSVIFIGGYFYVVASLISGDIIIPEGQAQLVTVLLGVMTAGVANVMQFWFGSSSGSKEKTGKLR